MKRRKMFVFLGVIFCVFAGLGGATASEDEALGPAAAGLERLKILAGEWQGQTADGKATRLSLSVIAGGTAVMERFVFASAPEGEVDQGMYTLYHLDGEHLMLTHYCISNNQPRMRAALGDEEADVLRFDFLDSTNLADPKEGHMHRAMIRFVDDDHFANQWTYMQGGEEVYSVVAEYERVR